jgi:hypothetical protein
VGISVKIKEAATTVGAKVIVALFAETGVGVVEAKTITVLAGQRLMGLHLIEHAYHCRMIEQDL